MKKKVLDRCLFLLALSGAWAWLGSPRFVEFPEVSAQSEKREKVFAVLIGLNEYQDTRISRLRFTIRDAEGIAAALISAGRVPKENVLLLTNAQATSQAIHQALEGWLSTKLKSVGKSEEQPTVFLFFAGHGYAMDGVSYWITYDTDRDRIAQTSVDHRRIEALLKRLGSRRTLVAVDACHSGYAWSGKALDDKELAMARKGFRKAAPTASFGEGHVVIAAAMQDQYSLENPRLRHGIFSYVMIQGLQGQADYDRDGRVTLPELWLYLSSNVRNMALTLSRYPQTPVKTGPEAGSIPLTFPPTRIGTSEAVAGAPPPRPARPSRTPEEIVGLLLGKQRQEARSSAPEGSIPPTSGSSPSELPTSPTPSGSPPASGSSDALPPPLPLGLGFSKPGQKNPHGGLLAPAVEKRGPVLPPTSEVKQGLKLQPQPRLAASVSEASPVAAGHRQTFQAGGATFAMRYIPAGSFVMGSPPNEGSRDPDEGPQRKITLRRGFWMLETEVTQAQYKALMAAKPSDASTCGPRCPVEQVSWEDAQAFAAKLSQAQGLPACTSVEPGILTCRGWRLPTEAEWEYAARAGTTTAFHTGPCLSTDHANVNGEETMPGCPKGTDREKSLPVGSFPPNAWGLFDLHGNVSEWVLDRYHVSYQGLPAIDPFRHEGGKARVLRGGSFMGGSRSARSAERSSLDPKDRYRDLGFRLLRL